MLHVWLTHLLAVALPYPAFYVDSFNGLRCSVVGVGDANGDRIADFALAWRGTGPCRRFDPSAGMMRHGARAPVMVQEHGWVWILSGADGSPLLGLETANSDPSFGRALASIHALDGTPAQALAVAGKGTIRVYSGPGLSSVLQVDSDQPQFARTIAGGGDWNADGKGDLLVFENKQSALVYSIETSEPIGRVVLSGTPQAPKTDQSTPAMSTVAIQAEELSGPLAFVARRGGQTGCDIALVAKENFEGKLRDVLIVVDRTGAQLLRTPVLYAQGSEFEPWELRSLGDFNGDGAVEIGVSVINEFVLVYSGADGRELQRISFRGGNLHEEGSCLEGTGDLDGDGIPDFLYAANEDGWDCDGGFLSTRSGADKPLTSKHFSGEGLACGVGVDACHMADVNQDGVDDIAVHLPRLRQAAMLSGKTLEVIWKVDLQEDRFAPDPGR